MAKQNLDGAKISAGFQHVRGATVSKNVGRDGPVNAGTPSGEVARHSNRLALHGLVRTHLGRE
jgi:hypothetical protein